MAATLKWRSPPYIHTDELADLLNEQAGYVAWEDRKVRRWLIRHEAAEKHGGRWLTTRELLREKCPYIWREVLVRLSEDGE